MNEDRKSLEAEFHDKLREDGLKKDAPEFERLTSNYKFYSITKRSKNFADGFLKKNCRGKKVLDFCCGEGELSVFLAENGANVFGIDISPVSIENSKKEAEKRGLKNAIFLVMDAERLEFEDNFFDLIVCSGVLHHLDIRKAYRELFRVIKPDGKVVCIEPLAYNPAFQLYRKMTPQLRTEWEAEHILTKGDIEAAGKYFKKNEKRFFHLLDLLAVPFRNVPVIFNPILSVLSFVDFLILSLPLIKWWAWQVIFILSEPKKDGGTQTKGN